jgi:hypothetical protein
MSASAGGLDRAFLDWRGTQPRTRTNEDQWLYFCWQDPGFIGSAAFQYKVKYYLSDGTDATITFLTTPTIARWEVYALPAGFTQLGLSTYETPTVKVLKYETYMSLTVLGVPTDFSERKVWRVDRAYQEFALQLQYINSLGCMEQLTLRGSTVIAPDINATSVDTYRDNSYTANQGESIVYDVLVENRILVSTGTCTRQEARRIADLKASHYRFLLSPSRGQYNIPLTIKGGVHPVDEQQNVYRYQLELSQNFIDSVPDMLQ